MKVITRVLPIMALVLLAGISNLAAGEVDDGIACGKKNITCLKFASSAARLEVRLRVGSPQPDNDPAVDYFLELDGIQGESQSSHRNGVRVVAFRGNVATTADVATALLAGLAVLEGKITPAYAHERTGLEIDLVRDTFGARQTLPDAPAESMTLNFTALSLPYVSQNPGDKTPPTGQKAVEELTLIARQFGLLSPVPSCSPLPGAACNLSLQYGVDFSLPVPMLTITVTDQTGTLVPGALVDACIHGQLQSSGQAVTNANGLALMPIPAAQAIDGVTVQTPEGGTFKTCTFGAATCAPVQPIG